MTVVENSVAVIRSLRKPTLPERKGEAARNLGCSHVLDGDFEARIRATGCVAVSRLVYTAHLGLVDAAYAAALSACLGPHGADDDIMGPDAYRT